MSIKYVLIQARDPSDIAKPEEHASFAERIGVSVSSIHSLDIFKDEMSIQRLSDYDAVLVGGSGEYSVLDKDKVIVDFINFLGEISNTDIPMFASCFGFQALTLAMGGEIINDGDNAEVGTYVLTPTSEAVDDELFSHLPNPFFAQLGHQDQASRLPATVTNLASSERTIHQAFKVNDKFIYATQFHPELTYIDNQKRFRRYMHIYGELFGKVEAQRILDSHSPTPEANQLLNNFHQKIIGISKR